MQRSTSTKKRLSGPRVPSMCKSRSRTRLRVMSAYRTDRKTGSRLTCSWNESAFARSNERTRDVESNFARHESLRPRYQRPHHHEQRKNLLEAVSLDQKLNGKLGGQEAQKLHSRSIVVIVLCHSQIRQHIVRQCIGYVSSVKLESEEHQA